jgi:hypothetical protein
VLSNQEPDHVFSVRFSKEAARVCSLTVVPCMADSPEDESDDNNLNTSGQKPSEERSTSKEEGRQRRQKGLLNVFSFWPTRHYVVKLTHMPHIRPALEKTVSVTRMCRSDAQTYYGRDHMMASFSRARVASLEFKYSATSSAVPRDLIHISITLFHHVCLFTR